MDTTKDTTMIDHIMRVHIESIGKYHTTTKVDMKEVQYPHITDLKQLEIMMTPIHIIDNTNMNKKHMELIF